MTWIADIAPIQPTLIQQQLMRAPEQTPGTPKVYYDEGQAFMYIGAREGRPKLGSSDTSHVGIYRSAEGPCSHKPVPRLASAIVNVLVLQGVEQDAARAAVEAIKDHDEVRAFVGGKWNNQITQFSDSTLEFVTRMAMNEVFDTSNPSPDVRLNLLHIFTVADNSAFAPEPVSPAAGIGRRNPLLVLSNS
ncbi:MAG: hypothetical protein WDO70_10720 [Alphaproteobacteria bacterium]